MREGGISFENNEIVFITEANQSQWISSMHGGHTRMYASETPV